MSRLPDEFQTGLKIQAMGVRLKLLLITWESQLKVSTYFQDGQFVKFIKLFKKPRYVLQWLQQLCLPSAILLYLFVTWIHSGIKFPTCNSTWTQLNSLICRLSFVILSGDFSKCVFTLSSITFMNSVRMINLFKISARAAIFLSFTWN